MERAEPILIDPYTYTPGAWPSNILQLDEPYASKPRGRKRMPFGRL